VHLRLVDDLVPRLLDLIRHHPPGTVARPCVPAARELGGAHQ
jgi:hypothetical protein